MKWLVDLMFQAAETGDSDTVGEIIVHGDAVLQRGTAADPDIVSCLVRFANRRYEQLRDEDRRRASTFHETG